MKALVLGGSGQMGRAVAAALLNAGWEVTVATGGGRPLPPGLAGQGARRVESGRLTGMVGSGADLLFDPFCMTAEDVAIRRAVAGDIGHFVVVSTASVYVDDDGLGFETPEGFPDYGGPLREDNPTVPAGSGYSAGKVAMEWAFQDAGLPVTLLRPGAIHGAGARHPREWVVVKRILDGRSRFPVRGRADARFQTTAAENVARAVLSCVHAGATGPVNVGDPAPPSVSEIIALIASGMEREITVVPVDGPEGESHVGSTPWSVPHDVILDCGRLRAMGWRPITYAQALPHYLHWMVEAGKDDWRAAFPGFRQYPHDPFDYAAEDRVLPPA